MINKEKCSYPSARIREIWMHAHRCCPGQNYAYTYRLVSVAEYHTWLYNWSNSYGKPSQTLHIVLFEHMTDSYSFCRHNEDLRIIVFCIIDCSLIKQTENPEIASGIISGTTGRRVKWVYDGVTSYTSTLKQPLGLSQGPWVRGSEGRGKGRANSS